MFLILLLYADDTILFCNLEDIDIDNKEVYTNSEIATRPCMVISQ